MQTQSYEYLSQARLAKSLHTGSPSSWQNLEGRSLARLSLRNELIGKPTDLRRDRICQWYGRKSKANKYSGSNEAINVVHIRCHSGSYERQTTKPDEDELSCLKCVRAESLEESYIVRDAPALAGGSLSENVQ